MQREGHNRVDAGRPPLRNKHPCRYGHQQNGRGGQNRSPRIVWGDSKQLRAAEPDSPLNRLTLWVSFRRIAQYFGRFGSPPVAKRAELNSSVSLRIPLQ